MSLFGNVILVILFKCCGNTCWWKKNVVEIRVVLFKQQKLLFKQRYQTDPVFPNNQAKYVHPGWSASQEWKKEMSSRAAEMSMLLNSTSVFLQGESHTRREIKKYMYLLALNMHILTSKAKKNSCTNWSFVRTLNIQNLKVSLIKEKIIDGT